MGEFVLQICIAINYTVNCGWETLFRNVVYFPISGRMMVVQWFVHCNQTKMH